MTKYQARNQVLCGLGTHMKREGTYIVHQDGYIQPLRNTFYNNRRSITSICIDNNYKIITLEE